MLFQEFRQSLRSLAKNPMFTVLSVLTLALGIGATTAMFSIVNAILLRELPYRDADRLVQIVAADRRSGSTSGPISALDFEDWKRSNQALEDMAAVGVRNLNLTGEYEPERIDVEFVSPNYFRMLGLQPELGRSFLPEENDPPAGRQVAILSHDLWQHRFGGRQDVVGKPLNVNGQPYVVIGVMPAGCRGTSDDAALWLPFMAVSPLLSPSYTEQRNMRWFVAYGHLKPGVTVEQAQMEMNRTAGELEKEYPDSNTGFGVSVIPAQKAFFGKLRAGILMLLCGAVLVLLIAIANVTNLLLVRATRREGEVSLRLALGARRWFLVRQWLIESLILAVLAGALGIVFSLAGTKALVVLAGVKLPSFTNVDVDVQVLGVGLVIILMTGLALGIFPALHMSRTDSGMSLKSAASHVSAGRRLQKVGRMLIVTEMALAIVLLILAALIIQSFTSLMRTDPGFRTRNMLAMQIDLKDPRFEDLGAIKVLEDRLEQEVQSLPGVEKVSFSSPDFPLGGAFAVYFKGENSAITTGDGESRMYLHYVSPSFFSSFGIPFAKGRPFQPEEVYPPGDVTVINESAARTFWPGQNAVGKRLKPVVAKREFPWYTVVGVVKDMQYRGKLFASETTADIYFPLVLAFQQTPYRNLALIVHTEKDSATVVEPIRKAVQKLVPDRPIYDVGTIEQRLAEEAAPLRFSSILLTTFGVFALVLAALGIYGVISYSVAQRKREMGIRMALGAKEGDIVRLVVKQAMVLAFCGIVIGVVGAFSLRELVASILYQVSPTHSPTYIVISLLMTGIACLASALPALTMLKGQPISVLREQ